MYNVLFRGLIGKIFSTGMDDLHKKVGFPGSVYPYTAWREVAEETVHKYKNGTISGPIIVGGHSLGAVSAVRFVIFLMSNGVPVRILFLFDYVWTLSNQIAKMFGRGLKIPNNIDHAIHFFSNDERVEQISGCVNEPRYDLNHIELDNDEKVHEKVLEYIKRYV